MARAGDWKIRSQVHLLNVRVEVPEVLDETIPAPSSRDPATPCGTVTGSDSRRRACCERTDRGSVAAGTRRGRDPAASIVALVEASGPAAGLFVAAGGDIEMASASVGIRHRVKLDRT